MLCCAFLKQVSIVDELSMQLLASCLQEDLQVHLSGFSGYLQRIRHSHRRALELGTVLICMQTIDMVMHKMQEKGVIPDYQSLC